jgi:energy-coupling factor transporter ATP-binding protein EcfA2
VLLCDEVTSALDSKSCEVVLDLLHNYSRQGHCTIVTIHQPSTRILRRFDALLLMSPGGQQLYFGPTEAAGYGVQRVCRIIANAAHSFLLDLAHEHGESSESSALTADAAARQVCDVMTRGRKGASKFTAAEMLLELAAYSPSVPASPDANRPSTTSFDGELEEETGDVDKQGDSTKSLWRSGGKEGETWRETVVESVKNDGRGRHSSPLKGFEHGQHEAKEVETEHGDDLHDFKRMAGIVSNVFAPLDPDDDSADDLGISSSPPRSSASGGSSSTVQSDTQRPLLDPPPRELFGRSLRKARWHGGFCARFMLLCARSCRQWVRDPSLLAAQLGLVIVMAGLIGTFAYDMPRDFTVSNRELPLGKFDQYSAY